MGNDYWAFGEKEKKRLLPIGKNLTLIFLQPKMQWPGASYTSLNEWLALNIQK